MATLHQRDGNRSVVYGKGGTRKNYYMMCQDKFIFGRKLKHGRKQKNEPLRRV